MSGYVGEYLSAPIYLDSGNYYSQGTVFVDKKFLEILRSVEKYAFMESVGAEEHPSLFCYSSLEQKDWLVLIRFKNDPSKGWCVDSFGNSILLSSIENYTQMFSDNFFNGHCVN